jgi:NADH:ubiquinone oxidoreductase subunit 5 (subunit L)/multisubunit Na+/H+ antiporter MnhA subunit
VTQDWLLPGIAVAVAAPLAAAGIAATGRANRGLRLLAVAAAGIALAASLGVAAALHTVPNAPLAWGPTLGGGRLVSVDGLGAALLAYTALVSLAIALVAPRRMLEAAAVRRMLLGFAATR